MNRVQALFARPGRQTVLAGVAIQGCIAVTGILVARLLGVEDRGELVLLALLPLVLSQLGGLGVPFAVTYYIARGACPKSLISVLKVPLLTQTGVLFGLHAIFSFLIFGSASAEVMLAAALFLASGPFIFAQLLVLGILQGNEWFTPFNLLRIAPVAAYALGSLGLFATGTSSIVAVSIVWCAATISATVVAGAYLWRRIDETSTDVPTAMQVYSFAVKGVVGWVSPSETAQIDQLAIGLAFSPSSLGLYAVAGAVANLPRFVAQSVGMVGYPRAASERDPRAAEAIVWRYAVWSFAICGALVVVLELGIDWLVPFLFGDEFEGSVVLARVLLISALLVGVRRVVADGARGAGMPGAGTLAELLCLVALIPALLIGLDEGPLAVAAGFAVAYAAGLIFLIGLVVYGFRRQRGSTGAVAVPLRSLDDQSTAPSR